MLQTLHIIVPQVWAWIVAHESLMLALVGGATGLSVFAQTLIHKLQGQLDKVSPVKRKVYAFVLVQVLTALAALAAHLAANADFLQLYPRLATAVLFMHQLAVNPVYVKTVLPFLEFQASQTPAPEAPAEPIEATEPAVPATSIFVSQ